MKVDTLAGKKSVDIELVNSFQDKKRFQSNALSLFLFKVRMVNNSIYLEIMSWGFSSSFIFNFSSTILHWYEL